ncbi:MAG TPA: hypothetical protein VGG74_18750 [Kofleriaceae bacterium]
MRGIATSLLALFAGCVDGFQGSNIELDFQPGMPVQVSVGATPGAGEVAAATHFTLYAYQTSPDMTTGSLYAVTTFEVHNVVDLASPCFIDVGDHVPYPGIHVSQYAAKVEQDTGIPDPTNPPAGASAENIQLAATAFQRMANIQLLTGPGGVHAVTSASAGNYPALAADCTDTNGIPPPTCMDADSNARRLAACQAYWKSDPNYYEGTDRVLTSPLNGVSHGMVDGLNLINQSPIGGAGFFVDPNLVGFDGYAIYAQPDTQTTPGGDLLMFGTPTTPTRGVTHVDLATPSTDLLGAELAIFSNLGDDNVQF